MKPQNFVAASTFLLLCAFAAPLAAIPVEKVKKSPRAVTFSKGNKPAGNAFHAGQTTVSLSGRVITPTGKPIGNATLLLMDLDGVSRTVTTGHLGYYSFTGIVPGRTYILGVFHKRFIFASPTQTFDIDSDRTDVILIGEENF